MLGKQAGSNDAVFRCFLVRLSRAFTSSYSKVVFVTLVFYFAPQHGAVCAQRYYQLGWRLKPLFEVCDTLWDELARHVPNGYIFRNKIVLAFGSEPKCHSWRVFKTVTALSFSVGPRIFFDCLRCHLNISSGKKWLKRWRIKTNKDINSKHYAEIENYAHCSDARLPNRRLIPWKWTSSYNQNLSCGEMRGTCPPIEISALDD